MDLRQLDVLLAVAEHQSFSAAARALHTVQSNVSAHIAQLEREAGAVLIDRARRCLTPEGQVVADRARRIQLEMQAISDDLGAMQANLSGTVTVGVIGTTARWLVPRLLDETSRLHPLLEVIVLDATTTSLVPLLIQNRLDLAVVNLPVDDPDIETEDLFSEDRVVIAPAGHELADRDRIDLVELARHDVLLPPRGTAFRDEVDTDAAGARGAALPGRDRRPAPAGVAGLLGLRAGPAAGQRRSRRRPGRLAQREGGPPERPRRRAGPQPQDRAGRAAARRGRDDPLDRAAGGGGPALHPLGGHPAGAITG